MHKILNVVNSIKERMINMKNKDKKKGCKDCNCNEVIEKKVKTMENGKEYGEEVEKKEQHDVNNQEE